jgi:serine/threonine protein kinase
MSSLNSLWKDSLIRPDRLEWSPDDRRKVEHGGSLLGEGTFGSVYRGEMDGGAVAIKVIKAPQGQPNERVSAGRKAAEEQHAREIRRLVSLSFRHVVQCYGVSPAPNSNELLIITECLDGGSLHQSLERVRKADATLTDTSFLTICSHIAKGLRYIHSSRYIHGDMKPHNVLLNVRVIIDERSSSAYFPSHVEAKVADFGMSKRLQSEDSLSLAMSTVEFGNQPFGTYAYMAPESFQGVRDLDDDALKAVDVFAFGVLIYEMLSGMSPWKFEGVASPMQLQRLVVFEDQRPNWGTRVIRDEFRRLVELCWHVDSRRRPTAKDLSITFDGWLKEARQRDTSETSSVSGGSSSSSCLHGDMPASHAAPTPNGRARDPPPRLPVAPSIIRNDNNPGAFTRVVSSAISPEVSRRRDYADHTGAEAGRNGGSRNGQSDGLEYVPDLPCSPSPDSPSNDDCGVRRIATEDRHVDDYNGEGRAGEDNESGSESDGRSDGRCEGAGNSEQISDSGGDTGSGNAVESSRSNRSSEDDLEAAKRRRNYWEKRGPSVKHSVTVQETPPGYDIGNSLANEVGVDGNSAQDAAVNQGMSAPQSGRNSLELTMGEIEITRVETQILQEPERPQLNLPVIPGLESVKGRDGDNAGDKTSKQDTLWGNSMLEAVQAQNEVAGPSHPVVQAQAVGAMVQHFEARSKQHAGVDADSSLRVSSHSRSVSSPATGQAAAMAAMGMELPVQRETSHRRAASTPADVDVDAELRLFASNRETSPDLNATAEDSQGTSGLSSNPNDRVSPPEPSSHRLAPTYPAPLQQTMPAVPSLHIPGQPQGSANGQPSKPALASQPQQPVSAGTYPNLPTQPLSSQPLRPPQLTIGDVLQALQAPEGVDRVMKWWNEGHAVVIASAMAREDQRMAGVPRLKVLVSLLREVTTSQSQVKSATNARVARDLCIALGNVSRGGSIDRPAAELALPATLTTMQAFTYDMNVYSAACYALANVLKVSNDIANDRVRTDVADWISHATSFNLNNQRGGPQPTLAYTTAAAARNFIWRKVANANAFFTRRRAQTAVHPSAAENMCKSMLFFQRDPTVVEACLSAYAALAYFPSHRISLITIGVVSAVARVMDRPTNQQNAALLTMGLATLGIIVAREATATETTQIVDAFIKEGGVRCVVKALADAVRARNSRVTEEGLYALASIARFDQRLGRTVVQTGGVGTVITAVSCSVEGAPEAVTVRSAEVMCDVVDVLSQHAAAASAMRQATLSRPLQSLVDRFSSEPKVTSPGRQAIARVW